MAGKLSFNEGCEPKDCLKAKEAIPEKAYQRGPIKIGAIKDFWVLASINHDSEDPEDVLKNLRIKMNISEKKENVSVVTCTISCDNGEVKSREYKIEFTSDVAFTLEPYEKSAYMYTSLRGLHSDHAIALSEDIFNDKGALIGYEFTDGLFPGGKGNSITVSIRVHAIEYGLKKISDNGARQS